MAGWLHRLGGEAEFRHPHGSISRNLGSLHSFWFHVNELCKAVHVWNGKALTAQLTTLTWPPLTTVEAHLPLLVLLKMESQNPSIFWVARDPQWSWSPALKWMAHRGIKPMTLVLLAQCSNQWTSTPPQWRLFFQQESPLGALATPITGEALVLSEISDCCCHVITTKRREAVFCEIVFSQEKLLMKHE